MVKNLQGGSAVTATTGDEVVDDLAMRGEGRERAFLVDMHQSRLARDAGCENGGELPFEKGRLDRYELTAPSPTGMNAARPHR
jgi:hypothetical protein